MICGALGGLWAVACGLWPVAVLFILFVYLLRYGVGAARGFDEFVEP